MEVFNTEDISDEPPQKKALKPKSKKKPEPREVEVTWIILYIVYLSFVERRRGRVYVSPKMAF